jgi:parallel beta-helix repeat protein
VISLDMRRTKLVSNPLLFAAVALILCAALAVPASAANLTVGTGGQFKTIQEAVDAAKPGDTVLVAPGTYTENVVVSKPLTITGNATVNAADSSKDVFLITSPGVHIDGLTISGGETGVNVAGVASCAITNITEHGNVFAVYLANATNSIVSNNNLANNHYGVYCDYATSNTIANNVATGESGGGNNATYSDGIYLYYSNSNNVTQNNLSDNHVYGISLFYSSGNDISNNTIQANDNIGVRLGEAADNNTLSFNTIGGSSQLGILILNAQGNRIYLNNFVNQTVAISDASAAILNSPEKMAYTYGGVERTGYMSNYYSDYKGNDSNGTGIGSTPSAYGDQYPLVQPVASYGTIMPASAVTATTSPSLSNSQNASTIATSNQSSAGTGLPGFETPYAVAGLLIAALVVLLKRRR